MTIEPSIRLKIVLVEDHTAVRRGVEAILSKAGHVVAGATDNPHAAKGLVHAEHPDVVLVDLRLPHGSGLWLARAVLLERPGQAVLLYTGFPLDKRISEALALGVRGVALKAGAPEELVAAVETVAAGRTYLDPRLAEAPATRAESRLSKREREVFGYLAAGLTGEDIALRLVLSPETIRTHVRNGIRHLGARTRVHAIALALARGEVEPAAVAEPRSSAEDPRTLPQAATLWATSSDPSRARPPEPLDGVGEQLQTARTATRAAWRTRVESSTGSCG